MDDSKEKLPRLGIYHHFKGNDYVLMAIARHSEHPDMKMAVYHRLGAPDNVWVRPVSMWEEKVLHDGKEVARFTYIGE